MPLHPLLYPADAGEPLADGLVARPKVERLSFPVFTRQVSIRNTGTNTLWIALPSLRNGRRKWFFDLACGTSWDDRVCINELWYCTQVGTTRFAVIGLALVAHEDDEGDEEEPHASHPAISTRHWTAR